MGIRRAGVTGAIVLALATVAGADEPTHSFITASDGLRVHYIEQGTGTPVILIHGYTANAEWKWFRPGIAAALATTHRVVAIDARGHGQSEKPHDAMRYGPRMAQNVIELMDALGIDRAHVHGYSMGGSLLTQILKSHPNRVITAIYGGSGVREVDPVWVSRIPDDPETPEVDPAHPRPGERWATYPGFDRAALDAVSDYPWTEEQHAIDLRTIDIPVLAIVGGYDRPNNRTHRMQRELKDFTRVVLPGETHGSAHFNPKYTETLVEFVKAHTP